MSEKEEKHYHYSGIGFTGMLTILFIALILTHYIDWGWWWVLSPLWISAAIWLILLLIGLIIFAVSN
jgi:hypothetical protein